MFNPIIDMRRFLIESKIYKIANEDSRVHSRAIFAFQS